jgi:cyclophilin family peptidyl-prolyl cis-trans isomerase
MPRSRRFRKNQDKPEWGKNNPQTKEKNRKMLIAIGIIAVAAVAISLFFVFGYSSLFPSPAASPSPSSTPSPSASTTPTATPVPTPSGTPQPSATPATSPVGEYSANGTRILLVTSMGNITVQLRDDKYTTSGNFLNLTQLGIYDGTIFHRVIAGFMVQGGMNTTTVISPIPDEIGNDNHNVIGTVAMAKTSLPNSATSQFFINVGDNSPTVYPDGSTFDGTYTVFGKVIGGMDVVNAISHVTTTGTSGSPPDMPLQDVTIIKAIVLP